MLRMIATFIVLFGLSLPAVAVDPSEVLDDPALEERARDLSAKLRCLVCQNQSIDDSNADLARDLRVLVRQRLVAGDSNDAVLDYVVARYGEYVLLNPVFGTHTLVLWFAAPALFLIGGVWIGMTIGRKRKRPATLANELTAEERARLDKLIGEDAG